MDLAPTLKSPEWVKSEMVSNIISLAGNNGNLYALTREGVIYKNEYIRNNHKWLKIAYRNNETIKRRYKTYSIS